MISLSREFKGYSLLLKAFFNAALGRGSETSIDGRTDLPPQDNFVPLSPSPNEGHGGAELPLPRGTG